MGGDRTILDLVNVVVIVALSTAFHEGAHAWTADRFGDDTPRRAGRMTWNPLAHIDPVGSVLVPAAMFWMSGFVIAWGSTPVTPSNMRNPRLHGALSSAAGPGANFALAILAIVAACAFVLVQGGVPGAESGAGQVLHLLFRAFVFNVFLGLFNLVPLPPLDGSHVLMAALPLRYAVRYASLRQYAFYAFLLLAITGILGEILAPVVRLLSTVAGFFIALAGELARG